MSNKALIYGISGQGGSYLAEILLSKGYEVAGFKRRVSVNTNWRIEHIEDHIKIYHGDITEFGSVYGAIESFRPDEVYNMVAMSYVTESFQVPQFCAYVTAIGCLNVLEAIQRAGLNCKFWQASSSEQFGLLKGGKNIMNEESEFHPRSPYGVAKVFAHQMTVNYREAYGMFNCISINFNNESPRRGEEFVSRKITKAVARIKLGKQNKLMLGDISTKRDWGYCPEYMEDAWQIMQLDKPDTFVFSTGETHTVQEFVEKAFEYVGLDWKEHR